MTTGGTISGDKNNDVSISLAEKLTLSTATAVTTPTSNDIVAEAQASSALVLRPVKK